MNEQFDFESPRKGATGFHDILHIQKMDQLSEAQLFDCSAIVIEVTNEKVIKDMLNRIRRMRYKSFYLKPVLLQEGDYSKEIILQTDGILLFDDINNIMARISRINRRIKEVRSVTSRYTFSESLLVKSLQFLFTRNMELIPFLDRSQKLSYCYPFLSNIIGEMDQMILLEVLERGAKEGLFEHELVDKVNLCKNCSGTYHNFREVCPQCESLNLESVDLIHHFRCAYIGPSIDFEDGQDLVCPKCDKELRHIGIDYDKPSEIFECRACGHKAQEPHMKAHCVDCHEENELEYLKTKHINRYRMTVYGADIAENGLQKIDENKLPKLGDQRVVPFETWEVLLKHEIARQGVRQTRSKIFAIELKQTVISKMDPYNLQKLLADNLETTDKLVNIETFDVTSGMEFKG